MIDQTFILDNLAIAFEAARVFKAAFYSLLNCKSPNLSEVKTHVNTSSICLHWRIHSIPLSPPSGFVSEQEQIYRPKLRMPEPSVSLTTWPQETETLETRTPRGGYGFSKRRGYLEFHENLDFACLANLWRRHTNAIKTLPENWKLNLT